MATDVKPNLFPTPATASAPAPRASAPASRAPVDGRKFADELRDSDSATGAQRAAEVAQKTAERAGEAADQFNEDLGKKLKDVADSATHKPKVAEAAGTVTAEAVVPATLDSKAFGLAVRKHAQAARSSDPLAFLSGRLESIDPGSIADLVAENPFISQALASSDLAGMMRQPVPAETLLAQFEVPSDVIQAIEAAGIDLSQTITPRDFLRALGVDPNRVSAELTMLANALPVDGVQPYVERAARLQGKPVSPSTAPSTAQQIKDPKKSQQANHTDAQRPGAMPIAMPNPSTGAGTKVDPKPAPAPVRPAEPGVASLAAAKGQMAKVAGPQQSVAPLTMPVEGLARETLAAQGQALESLAADSLARAPQMRTTDIDPFHQMSQRGTAFQSLDLAAAKPPVQPLGSTDSLEEALVQTNWTPGKPVVAETNPFDSIGGQLQQLAQQSQTASPLGVADASTNGAVTMQMAEGASEQVGVESTWQAPTNVKPAANSTSPFASRDVATTATSLAAQTSANPTKLEHRIPIEDLQLDASQWTRDSAKVEDFEGSFTGTGGGDGQHQQTFQDGGSPLAFDRPANPGDFRLGESMFAPALSHGAISGPTPGERADAVQQIMDRAIMMTRSGGGSINLDLSGLSIGQLEMAISVSGNRVDMKILAESENVREILAGDLSVLRDAMSAQNMSLTSIDVGVGKRDGEPQPQFAGSQQFDQQAQQQARELQNEFSDFMTGVTRRVQDAIPLAGLRGRMPIIPPMAYSQGQIAVRA